MPTETDIYSDARLAEWGDSDRVGVWNSARRHRVLATLPIILLVGAAVFFGLARGPSYSAESRLIVGRLDISAPGALAGFQEATQSLAAAYSRAIVADAVVDPVSKQLRIDTTSVRDQTSATPIQNANVFKIDATGPDARTAVSLANAMTTSLIRYVLRLNRTNPDAPRLLAQFRSAALRYERALRTQQRLDSRATRTGSLGDQQAANQARVSTQQALLERETFRTGYQTSQEGQSSSSQIQVLAPAARASNDRTTVLEELILAGLVAGILVGLAAATLRENSRRARRQAGV